MLSCCDVPDVPAKDASCGAAHVGGISVGRTAAGSCPDSCSSLDNGGQREAAGVRNLLGGAVRLAAFGGAGGGTRTCHSTDRGSRRCARGGAPVEMGHRNSRGFLGPPCGRGNRSGWNRGFSVAPRTSREHSGISWVMQAFLLSAACAGRKLICTFVRTIAMSRLRLTELTEAVARSVPAWSGRWTDAGVVAPSLIRDRNPATGHDRQEVTASRRGSRGIGILLVTNPLLTCAVAPPSRDLATPPKGCQLL